MNKKILFTVILFTLLCSTSYGYLKEVSFTDGTNTLNLQYTINKGPTETIMVFYIPTITDYYHWNIYNKLRFEKDVFYLVLSLALYNSEKDLNIIVRSKKFPLISK